MSLPSSSSPSSLLPPSSRAAVVSKDLARTASTATSGSTATTETDGSLGSAGADMERGSKAKRDDDEKSLASATSGSGRGGELFLVCEFQTYIFFIHLSLSIAFVQNQKSFGGAGSTCTRFAEKAWQSRRVPRIATTRV